MKCGVVVMKHKLYQNTKRFTRLFCVGIACVTVAVLALRLTVFSDKAVPVMAGAGSGIITGSPDSEGGSGTSFPYTLNGSVYYASADAKGNVLIQNLSKDQYLMSVDVRLVDSGVSVYFTGFINPGASIDSAKLGPEGQTLEDGVYECTAQIAIYDPETLEPLGSEEQPIHLYIGEKPEKSKSKK